MLLLVILFPRPCYNPEAPRTLLLFYSHNTGVKFGQCHLHFIAEWTGLTECNWIHLQEHNYEAGLRCEPTCIWVSCTHKTTRSHMCAHASPEVVSCVAALPFLLEVPEGFSQMGEIWTIRVRGHLSVGRMHFEQREKHQWHLGLEKYRTCFFDPRSWHIQESTNECIDK